MPSTPTPHITACRRLLVANTGGGRRRVNDVFRDFCELAAISLRNVIDTKDADVREARYHEIAGKYSDDERTRFVETLAHLTLALEEEMQDALGELYMSLDLGNAGTGQFFTPYSVSLLSARMTIADVSALISDRGFATMAEPTCGSGGMVIATAQVFRDAGVNYQKHLHVTAHDIDITAVHMAYIQLSLLGVPAVVVHGDTLSLETRDTWPTAFHVLGGWPAKLSRPATVDPAKEAAS